MIRQLRAHGDCPKAYQLTFQRMKPEGFADGKASDVDFVDYH
jgi:hypothetical protein